MRGREKAPLRGREEHAQAVLCSTPVPGQSNMTNDEVLARMMSRMDLFDTRLKSMETMIADRFQSIEIMNGSLDSRMDTMQGQLQTILQLLQPPPPPEH
ncbi:hypothetical protein JCGZ_01672 [Jatropha curcas]|uniref:Uncharacterized protein n=1 Tax=Jatropha curcas TaxID=180498 RepID=A0A067LEW7_JATCU|nr:hypothetical protein JCGZ_01672 [Jatropha curcas]